MLMSLLILSVCSNCFIMYSFKVEKFNNNLINLYIYLKLCIKIIYSLQHPYQYFQDHVLISIRSQFIQFRHFELCGHAYTDSPLVTLKICLIFGIKNDVYYLSILCHTSLKILYPTCCSNVDTFHKNNPIEYTNVILTNLFYCFQVRMMTQATYFRT